MATSDNTSPSIQTGRPSWMTQGSYSSSRYEPAPRHAHPAPTTDHFAQTKFALNCVSILGLGLVKSSILVLYNNIFKVRKFQLCIYAMLAYVVGWTISFFFSHLFTCYPITVFIEPYYGNKCVKTVPMFLALLFTDVIADVIILVLPVPMVLHIQLPLKKKLAVMGMLMLGAAYVPTYHSGYMYLLTGSVYVPSASPGSSQPMQLQRSTSSTPTT